MGQIRIEKLLDIVYPENLYCLCCGDTMEQSRIHGICDACAEKIQWYTDNPYRSIMDEFCFEELYACCRYGFYIRKIMNLLKLSGKSYIAKGPGRLMGELVTLRGGEFDYLVPVPIHPNKLKKRGYNQAKLLAEYASKVCGIPVLDAMLKSEEGKSMRYSTGLERRTMLQNSFAVSEDCAEQICGKSLLLVDDVITTGGTADTASRVLLNAGAASVSVLCFAAGHQ